jgi:hypothetical protein
VDDAQADMRAEHVNRRGSGCGESDAKEVALSQPIPEDAGYEFSGGYPSPETVQRAYDDADLNRAVQAYRFFFPSVSGLAIFKGNEALGLRANSVFGTPDHQA